MSEPEFNPTSEQIDRWYDMHCQAAEKSRVAMLKVIIAPISRRSLTTEPAELSREEFEKGLRGMPQEVRAGHLADLERGYDAAIARYKKGSQHKTIVGNALRGAQGNPPSGGLGK